MSLIPVRGSAEDTDTVSVFFNDRELTAFVLNGRWQAHGKCRPAVLMS